MTNIYTSDEIRHMLGAAGYATAIALHAGRDHPDEYVQGYHDGYHKALLTIAISFGLVTLPDSHELLPRAPYGELSERGSVHAEAPQEHGSSRAHPVS
jgi:hypothetical protein